MDKVKVFHIVTHFDLGGAERVAVNISKSKNKEFQYYLLEVSKGDSNFTNEFIQELEENDIKYYRSSIENKKLAIILFPIVLLLKYVKIKPDIIHSHTEVPDLGVYLFSFLARFFRLKLQVIRTIHNTKLWGQWEKIGRYVECYFIKKTSNIAISKSTRDEYYKVFNTSQIPLIYNGIEKTIQQEFDSLSRGKINVLFAGRLEYQKGVEELIQVVESLKNNGKYHFHIVGSGNLEKELKERLHTYTNVSFYDKIFNLSRYLKSFDYLFMPSKFEGLGLLSVEASMNGVPTIINNCIGLNETLPVNWELKVDNNSVKAYSRIFASTLIEMNREKLIEEAYDFVVEKFSVEKMQIEYEKIYNKKVKK
ncbi:glycosyltransferase family 4 protein [Wenyingzhuangia sp. IMCC45574]